MNILDDLRAEWIAVRKSLGVHIAYREAANKIHPIGQDPDEATTEFGAHSLRGFRTEAAALIWIAEQEFRTANAEAVTHATQTVRPPPH